ncbi:RloB family protein [Erysipelotrichaceae bacterium 51-3]
MITDGKQTEKAYFTSLKKAIDAETSGHLSLTIKTCDTDRLFETCSEIIARSNVNERIWIVVDRDEVKNFDRKIDQVKALAPERVDVAWSNPCFEVWFLYYFGKAKYFHSSQACWQEFGRLYKARLNNDYDKSEKACRVIYKLLMDCGDEEKAIQSAEQDHRNHCRKLNTPSNSNPCTTVYQLVAELKKGK